MTVVHRRHLRPEALVPEPVAHTQEVYALLDTVVQKVLTDKNADIDALLANANDPGPGAARQVTGPGRPASAPPSPRRRPTPSTRPACRTAS